ncbi:hypothetical protein [Spirosoma gilvum]
MKLAYLISLALGTLAITSCPRPQLPNFCDKPDHIFVDPVCYEANKGLTIRASPIESADTSIRLYWMVYILADSSQQAPFLHPQIDNVLGGYALTLSDSSLKANQKVYVEVRSSCAGVPGKKTVAINGNVFVRRYNQANHCYQWEEKMD